MKLSTPACAAGRRCLLLTCRTDNSAHHRPGRDADCRRRGYRRPGPAGDPPFVEPHIHLDATLTAGEPEWNRSGTLFEGITRWSQRKASITPEDTRQRALKTIGMLRDFGVQHVRTHVDVTDPSLSALKALLAVKQEAADLIDLQIVAFPQEDRIVPQRPGADDARHRDGRRRGGRHSAL